MSTSSSWQQHEQPIFNHGDVVVLNATVKAPPLNETLQLALMSSSPSSSSSSSSNIHDRAIGEKLASLLRSEPGVGVCDANPRERTANILTCAPFFMNGVDLLRRAEEAKRTAAKLNSSAPILCTSNGGVTSGRAAGATRNDTGGSGDTAAAGGHGGVRSAGGAWCDGGDHRVMRRYGLAMFGVGAAAVAYHMAPRGRRKTRAALRQLDFTSIALASTVASDAYGCSLPAVRRR